MCSTGLSSGDALVLVDLVRADPLILGRYMGQEEVVSFRRFNGAGLGKSGADYDLPDDKCA